MIRIAGKLGLTRESRRNLFSSDTALGEIVVGSGLTLLSRTMFAVISLIVITITSRFFGPIAVGQVATITTLVTMGAIVASLGTTSSVNYYMASQLARVSTRSARLTYWRIMGTCALGSTFAVFSILLLLETLSDTLFGGTVQSSLLVAAALGIFFKVTLDISTLVARTLNAMIAFAAFQALPAFVNLTLVVFLIHSTATVSGPAFAWIVSIGLVGVAGLVFVHMRFHRATDARTEIEIPDYFEIFKRSFPMLISTMGAFTISGSGIILMAGFADQAAVGVFSVALKLATTASFVLISINSITTPIFARLHSIGQIPEMISVARKTSMLMFWAIAPIVFVLFIFGRPMLEIVFGHDFVAAYPILLILLLGQLVNAMTGPTDFLMNMAGHEKALRNIILPSAVLNVVLGLFMIPQFNMFGAAFAYTISMIVWYFVSTAYLKRIYGVWIGYVPIVPVVLGYLRKSNC